MEKIGVGVITCNRPEFLRNLINSLVPCEKSIDAFVVVNDGKPITDYDLPFGEWIDNEVNLGVGKSKNKALKYLYEKGCDHLFLIEDDIIIKDSKCFDQYIYTSKITGVKHLNYCLHGGDNRRNNKPNPRVVIDYNDTKLDLYYNVYGALSYYHRDVISAVGYMDERYVNAMEHVDHTYDIIKAGYHPPFRWFADIHYSINFIEDQDYNHSKSVIRTGDWYSNLRRGVNLFKEKSGIDVCNPKTVYSTESEVIQYLKKVKQ